MKNSKAVGDHTSHFVTVNSPPIHHIDELAIMQDDELFQRLNELFRERDNARSTHVKTRMWEEEICYVKREIQLRHERHVIHEKWLSEQAENEPNEDLLPSADLDNQAFVNAWLLWSARTITNVESN